MHWTTVQGLYSICVDRKHRLKISGSPELPAMIQQYLKERCWRNARAQNVREWTGVRITTIYLKCEKYIHITIFDMLNTRH